MFDFLKDEGTYESRKVARTDIGKGIEVSTAFTSDEGFETAILDSESAYPVERYKTRADAERGHAVWVKKAPHLKSIVMLGGLGGLVRARKVKLVRTK